MTKCARCGYENRSTPQHRRFFKVIAATYHQWPEWHSFKPLNSEHVRSWLLIAAKHVIAVERDGLLSPNEQESVRKLHKEMHDTYIFTKNLENSHLLIAAKSIAYDKLPHKEACEVFAEVDNVVCSVLGVSSTDELLEEHARAA